MTDTTFSHHRFPENCSPKELKSRWELLVSEIQQLRSVGELYSNSREMRARSLILRMQAALTTWRLTGNKEPLYEAEQMMSEFMVGEKPPATVADALQFATAYLVHGDADDSGLPPDLVQSFREHADQFRKASGAGQL